MSEGFVRSSAAGQSLIWSLIAAPICSLQTWSGWFGSRCQTFAVVFGALMRADMFLMGRVEVGVDRTFQSRCWSHQESSNQTIHLKAASSLIGNAIKGFSEQILEPFVEGHERQMGLCLSVRLFRNRASADWLFQQSRAITRPLWSAENPRICSSACEMMTMSEFSKAIVCSRVPDVHTTSVKNVRMVKTPVLHSSVVKTVFFLIFKLITDFIKAQKSV